ncbi:MAG TPA: hypothetical protein VD907_05745 [Verrucomicrobiae bacterium]|nr:hypothetical protein [Verrucomicrobiae bacterium]
MDRAFAAIAAIEVLAFLGLCAGSSRTLSRGKQVGLLFTAGALSYLGPVFSGLMDSINLDAWRINLLWGSVRETVLTTNMDVYSPSSAVALFTIAMFNFGWPLGIVLIGLCYLQAAHRKFKATRQSVAWQPSRFGFAWKLPALTKAKRRPRSAPVEDFPGQRHGDAPPAPVDGIRASR